MTIHQITRLGFVNAYLVEEDDGLTLIDTTVKGGHKAILAQAEAIGKPVVRVALTHGHTDHVGGLDGIVAAVPGVEVSISKRDARPLSGDKSLDPGEPQGKLKGGWPTIKTVPGRQFEPGETVGSLEIVAAPGHTPGQVAFFDPRDGTLYCADAFTTIGRVAVPTTLRQRFPLAAMATWDKATALASARALRALNPSALAPGHGQVVADPGAAMDAAISRAS